MDRLEQLQSFIGKEFTASPSSFMRWLNPMVLSAEEGHLEFEYTVRAEWINPRGNLHGGITSTIIDDIIGSTMFTPQDDAFYTTIDNSVDYLSSAKKVQTI